MSVILFNTPFDGYRNVDGAAFEIPIKQIQFRLPGEPGISATVKAGKTLVSLTAPTDKLKSGMKVTIVSPKKTFNATISGGSPSITTGTPYIWLDSGVDYTDGDATFANGTKWAGGSITQYAEEASAASTGSSLKKYGLIAIIVIAIAGLAVWKMRKRKK
jgi:hypothetical protein